MVCICYAAPGSARRTVPEIETIFQWIQIGIRRGSLEVHAAARDGRVGGGSEAIDHGRHVASHLCAGGKGEAVGFDAVSGRILDAPGGNDHLVRGVRKQRLARDEGQHVVEGKHHRGIGDRLTTQRTYDDRLSGHDGGALKGFVDEQADAQIHRVIGLAGARNVVAHAGAAGVGFGLVRPDSHALPGAEAAGDQQVAQRQGELAGVDAGAAVVVAYCVAGVEVKDRLKGPHVHLVVAGEAVVVLELHVHALDSGQRSLRHEAQVRRVGSVDHPDAIAAAAKGEHDQQLAVAAPDFRPVTAGAAQFQHVEQHRVRRIADIVRGHPGTGHVRSVDQQVADNEGMADDSRFAQVVPGSERLAVAAQGGESAHRVVAPVGVDVPGSEQGTAREAIGIVRPVLSHGDTR